jgi:hypothetical protein
MKELGSLSKKLGCSSIHYTFCKKTFYDDVMATKFDAKNTNPVGFINLTTTLNPEHFKYIALDFDTY